MCANSQFRTACACLAGPSRATRRSAGNLDCMPSKLIEKWMLQAYGPLVTLTDSSDFGNLTMATTSQDKARQAVICQQYLVIIVPGVVDSCCSSVLLCPHIFCNTRFLQYPFRSGPMAASAEDGSSTCSASTIKLLVPWQPRAAGSSAHWRPKPGAQMLLHMHPRVR